MRRIRSRQAVLLRAGQSGRGGVQHLDLPGRAQHAGRPAIGMPKGQAANRQTLADFGI